MALALVPRPAQEASPKTRILVADDHAPIREVISNVLSSRGYEVVGQAEDGAAAVRLAKETRPDIVLLDVRMPGRDGLAALDEILRVAPGVRVLMLSTYEDPSYILRAVSSGASGYLLKGLSPDDLADAIERTVRGESLVESPLGGHKESGLRLDNSVASPKEVVEGHLEAFGALARELLRPEAGQGRRGEARRPSYYSMVQAVTAYGLAVAELLSTQRRERERLKAELDSRSQQVRQAREEAASSERQAALGHIVASAAHGLRTPLSIIGNALAILRMTVAPEDEEAFEKYRALMTAQLRKSEELLNQLSRYASVEKAQIGLGRLGAILDLQLSDERLIVRRDHDPRVLADPQLSQEAVGLLLQLCWGQVGPAEQVRVVLRRSPREGLLTILPGDVEPQRQPRQAGDRSLQTLLPTETSILNFEHVLSQALLEAQDGRLEVLGSSGGRIGFELGWPLATGGEP